MLVVHDSSSCDAHRNGESPSRQPPVRGCVKYPSRLRELTLGFPDMSSYDRDAGFRAGIGECSMKTSACDSGSSVQESHWAWLAGHVVKVRQRAVTLTALRGLTIRMLTCG